MKRLILACLLGLVGATASADECFYEAVAAARSKLEEQGLKSSSIHMDSMISVGKTQREINFNIKLFYWITLANGDALSSTDTKNFYVRMQLGRCRLITAPQPSS